MQFFYSTPIEDRPERFAGIGDLVVRYARAKQRDWHLVESTRTSRLFDALAQQRLATHLGPQLPS